MGEYKQTTSFNVDSIQKEIMKQKMVSSSQYQDNKRSLYDVINNSNEGVKHGSYQRFLDKKKGKVISNQERLIASTPKIGNKTKSVSLITTECLITSKCPTQPSSPGEGDDGVDDGDY